MADDETAMERWIRREENLKQEEDGSITDTETGTNTRDDENPPESQQMQSESQSDSESKQSQQDAADNPQTAQEIVEQNTRSNSSGSGGSDPNQQTQSNTNTAASELTSIERYLLRNPEKSAGGKTAKDVMRENDLSKSDAQDIVQRTEASDKIENKVQEQSDLNPDLGPDDVRETDSGQFVPDESGQTKIEQEDREQMVDQADKSLDEQFGRDLQRGEDYVLEESEDGGLQPQLTESFRREQAADQIEQKIEEDTVLENVDIESDQLVKDGDSYRPNEQVATELFEDRSAANQRDLNQNNGKKASPTQRRLEVEQKVMEAGVSADQIPGVERQNVRKFSGEEIEQNMADSMASSNEESTRNEDSEIAQPQAEEEVDRPSTEGSNGGGDSDDALSGAVGTTEDVIGADVPGDGRIIKQRDPTKIVEERTDVDLPESVGAVVAKEGGFEQPTEREVANEFVSGVFDAGDSAVEAGSNAIPDSPEGTNPFLYRAQVALEQQGNNVSEEEAEERISSQAQQFQENTTTNTLPVGAGPGGAVRGGTRIITSSDDILRGAGVVGAVAGGAVAAEEINIPNPTQSQQELETPNRPQQRRNELPVNEASVDQSELEVGSEQPSELDATESTRDRTEVEVPQETVDNPTFSVASQTVQRGVTQEQEQTPLEELIQDPEEIAEPDQRGPSVRERQRREDLDPFERSFPTGSGAVVGEDTPSDAQKRQEEAQTQETQETPQETIDGSVNDPNPTMPSVGQDDSSTQIERPVPGQDINRDINTEIEPAKDIQPDQREELLDRGNVDVNPTVGSTQNALQFGTTPLSQPGSRLQISPEENTPNQPTAVEQFELRYPNSTGGGSGSTPRDHRTPDLPDLPDLYGPSTTSDRQSSQGTVEVGDDALSTGWLRETIATAALGIDPEAARAPSQDTLESQPIGAQLTGELPTAAEVSGSQAEQEAIEDVSELFTFGGGFDGYF